MGLTLIGLGTGPDTGDGDAARDGGAKVNSCIAFVNSLAPPGQYVGFAGAPVDAGTLASVQSNWNTGATWGNVGPTQLVTAVAAPGNTDIHGTVSSGCAPHQTWTYYNPSNTDSTKVWNESVTCTTSADRHLTRGAQVDVIGPQSYATFKRDPITNRWTRMS